MNDTSAILPPIGGGMDASNERTAPVVSPPIGGSKRRGRPPNPLSIKRLAALYSISARSIERAVVVRIRGVPELHRLVQAGELKLGAAEYVARWPLDCQREACAEGADYLKRLIPLVRRAEAEERDECVTPTAEVSR